MDSTTTFEFIVRLAVFVAFYILGCFNCLKSWLTALVDMLAAYGNTCSCVFIGFYSISIDFCYIDSSLTDLAVVSWFVDYFFGFDFLFESYSFIFWILIS